MSKVVQFRQAKPSRSDPFVKMVILGMLLSFLLGASASYILGRDTMVATRGDASKDQVFTIIRGDQQNAQPLAITRSKPSVRYNHCVGSVRVNCVVDGDTIWRDGVKIRIADIDAPEVGKPRCAAEKVRGDRATLRLMELVNAGPFEMESWPGRDEDTYGRKLRVLVRDGRSLGDILVAEGLARTWSGKKLPWC